MPFFLLLLMFVAAWMFPPLGAVAAVALWILLASKRTDTSPDHIYLVADDGRIVRRELGA